MASAAPNNVLDPLLQDLGAQQTESQSQTAKSQASQTAEGQTGDDVGTKRSASYSESKDVQLFQSWIAISEDPLIGTNQDGATFWKHVHHSFSKDLPESRQTPGSLKAHWGALQKFVSKFRGFVNQVEQFGESGASAEDCLNRCGS
jgi:hypothetical protein